MQKLLLFISISFPCFLLAQKATTISTYTVADSIKAMGVYCNFFIQDNTKKSKLDFILQANDASITVSKNKIHTQVAFNFNHNATIMVQQPNVVHKGNSLIWQQNLVANEQYGLYILSATDSAKNATLYSAYIHFVTQNKWKLIGTIALKDTSTTIHYTNIKVAKGKSLLDVVYNNIWLQRSNGSWKKIDTNAIKQPTIRPLSNIDSATQALVDDEYIKNNVLKDSLVFADGIYYHVLKKGVGKTVQLLDTVVVHYKGWLLQNGLVFDATMDKPATFALTRLIKGWQIGVPFCNVGGKIRLYLPSGFAYGIRTSFAIPPNSILVFDVEVLATKEKQ